MRKTFWITTAAVAAGILLAAGLRRAFWWTVLPLLGAYVGARTVRPAGRFLAHAMKLPERLFLGLWSILVCAAAGCLLVTVSGKLLSQLLAVAKQLPAYAENLIGAARERLETRLPLLGRIRLGGMLDLALTEAAGAVGSAALSRAGEMAGAFPSFGVTLAVTAVGFCYLVTDMDGAAAGLRAMLGAILPENAADGVIRRFSAMSDAVFRLLRAYGILTLLTFAELLAGFVLCGVENPLAGAFLLALLDALPLFGCGAVLIPWGLAALLSGKMRRGAGLLLLSAVVWLIRQSLEPHLVGRASGVHPFPALLALCLGCRLGGIPGMILTTLALSCVMRHDAA